MKLLERIIEARLREGKTRLVHIRNEDIRKEAQLAQVKPVETFLENKRIKWFGHCLRREHNHMLEVAKTRSFWEKAQRSTEKEMEGQHKERYSPLSEGGGVLCAWRVR